jgi:hypothetical protein
VVNSRQAALSSPVTAFPSFLSERREECSDWLLQRLSVHAWMQPELIPPRDRRTRLDFTIRPQPYLPVAALHAQTLQCRRWHVSWLR